MAMNSVRSWRNSIWSTTMIVRIIYLVYWLVMPVGEYCRFALMIIETTDPWFMRLFRLKKLREIFRHSIERVFFFQRAGAPGSMTTTTDMWFYRIQCLDSCSSQIIDSGVVFIFIFEVRTVFLGMRLVGTLASDVLRTGFPERSAMLTLRYWTTLLIHMQ